jgi:hypothetical protein
MTQPHSLNRANSINIVMAERLMGERLRLKQLKAGERTRTVDIQLGKLYVNY